MGAALRRLLILLLSASANAFHCAIVRHAPAGKCRLDMVLLVERVCAPALGCQSGGRKRPALYPVNALRNRALAMAETQAVLLLDVDFLPSPALTTEYRSERGLGRISLHLNNRTAIVLPALATAPNAGTGPKAVSMALHAVIGETCSAAQTVPSST